MDQSILCFKMEFDADADSRRLHTDPPCDCLPSLSVSRDEISSLPIPCIPLMVMPELSGIRDRRGSRSPDNNAMALNMSITSPPPKSDSVVGYSTSLSWTKTPSSDFPGHGLDFEGLMIVINAYVHDPLAKRSKLRSRACKRKPPVPKE